MPNLSCNPDPARTVPYLARLGPDMTRPGWNGRRTVARGGGGGGDSLYLDGLHGSTLARQANCVKTGTTRPVSSACRALPGLAVEPTRLARYDLFS